jgi:hypothetical protein
MVRAVSAVNLGETSKLLCKGPFKDLFFFPRDGCQDVLGAFLFHTIDLMVDS